MNDFAIRRSRNDGGARVPTNWLVAFGDAARILRYGVGSSRGLTLTGWRGRPDSRSGGLRHPLPLRPFTRAIGGPPPPGGGGPGGVRSSPLARGGPPRRLPGGGAAPRRTPTTGGWPTPAGV